MQIPGVTFSVMVSQTRDSKISALLNYSPLNFNKKLIAVNELFRILFDTMSLLVKSLPFIEHIQQMNRSSGIWFEWTLFIITTGVLSRVRGQRQWANKSLIDRTNIDYNFACVLQYKNKTTDKAALQSNQITKMDSIVLVLWKRLTI